MNNLSYALVGSSGYIAPRHVRAVQDTGGYINSIIDINFTDESLKLFPRRVQKYPDLDTYIKECKVSADYIAICSPNFLHESQIILALNAGIDVICEKPVALSVSGLKKLQEIEKNSKAVVNTILQLRLHPVITKLKENIDSSNSNSVKITYVAKRDEQYFKTWKGQENLSGGLITNVGIHYLDLMTYLFGNFLDLKVKINEQNRSSGQLTLENCSVDWLFSFHDDDIDSYISEKNLSYRSIEINGQNVDFSDVPEDLHTARYKKIHKGEGFTLYDAQPSIEIIDKINL